MNGMGEGGIHYSFIYLIHFIVQPKLINTVKQLSPYLKKKKKEIEKIQLLFKTKEIVLN